MILAHFRCMSIAVVTWSECSQCTHASTPTTRVATKLKKSNLAFRCNGCMINVCNLCGKEIDGYEHFSDPNTPCYNNLWLGTVYYQGRVQHIPDGLRFAAAGSSITGAVLSFAGGALSRATKFMVIDKLQSVAAFAFVLGSITLDRKLVLCLTQEDYAGFVACTTRTAMFCGTLMRMIDAAGSVAAPGIGVAARGAKRIVWPVASIIKRFVFCCKR